MSPTITNDPAVASAIAAGRVPPEVSADWLNETRDDAAIAAIIFVLVLTSLALACRIVSRVFILKRIGPDDGLAVLSFILLVPFVVLCIMLIRIGSGRHYEYIMLVMNLDTVELSEVMDFAAHIVYTTALLICRLSGLAFYHRICNLHDQFLLAIKILAGVLVAGFLPQVFLLIFHCLPVTGLWPYDWQPDAGKYKCLQWGVVYSVNSSVSLFCDMLLFGIPIAMLWILDLTRRRTVQLACILLPGVLVVGISVARLILVIQGQWDPDQSWAYNPMLAIEVSEIGATLMALSVPGIKPMFDRWILRKKSPRSGTGGSKGTPSGKSSRSTHMLRNLTIGSRSRPHGGMHAILNSSDLTLDKHESGRHNVELGRGHHHRDHNDDIRGTASPEGIMVHVDFEATEHRAASR